VSTVQELPQIPQWALGAAGTLTVIALASLLQRLLLPKRRTRPPVSWANRLTYLGALGATLIAAQGMYLWLHEVLRFHPVAAFIACAFVEIAMLASALRARDNVRTPPYSTGPDGKAVWVFATLSGGLSASHAGTISEVIGRLSVTLVAGWLWERSLQVERSRHLHRERPGPDWARGPARLLARMGVIRSDQAAVIRSRSIDAYVWAIHELAQARQSGTGKDIAKATTRWNSSYRAAVEHAAIDTDPEAVALVQTKIEAIRRRSALLEHIATPSTPQLSDTGRALDPEMSSSTGHPVDADLDTESDRLDPHMHGLTEIWAEMCRGLAEDMRTILVDGLGKVRDEDDEDPDTARTQPDTRAPLSLASVMGPAGCHEEGTTWCCHRAW
jgi:hypothetical protein